MSKIEITEETHLEKEWFKEASNQTIDTLPEFINHIMNDYEHDYGTICHAVSACALAAAWAANKSESGGITGFQASFVMWDFIRQWLKTSNEVGMKLVDYDDMLYPQYGYKFEKTIRKDTWEQLQSVAKKRLEEKDEHVHPNVIAHWESIVKGVVPFGFTVTEC